MHPVSLQGDGLCHRYLHIMSRIYWKAEKRLCKAKTISNGILQVFFSAVKIKLEEKTQAKKYKYTCLFKSSYFGKSILIF